MYCTPEKQIKMLRVILDFHDLGLEVIRKGANIHQLRRMEVYSEILRIKFAVRNEEIDRIDEIRGRLARSIERVAEMFE